ncbi:hypothetical protein ABID29_001319 [Streptococcus rupicaprae]|uniref:Uncharacterized protein n=1 Tax=Streptococcus rupicaprae TaxID=759619 RepID=A0ABV2FI11_9STRE
MRLFQIYRILELMRFSLFLLGKLDFFEVDSFRMLLNGVLIPLSIFGFVYFLQNYDRYSWKIWYFFIPIWVPLNPRLTVVDAEQ